MTYKRQMKKIYILILIVKFNFMRGTSDTFFGSKNGLKIVSHVHNKYNQNNKNIMTCCLR